MKPMASILNPKGKAVTSLDVDRENFEKQQVIECRPRQVLRPDDSGCCFALISFLRLNRADLSICRFGDPNAARILCQEWGCL